MKIQKVTDENLFRNDMHSLAIIGDPGCEGLGTVMMQTYANALTEASKEDAVLVVGDFVPEGRPDFYSDVCSITEIISKKDVYALRGNHDTGDYDNYFGLHSYAVEGPLFTLVVIDNAMRVFEPQGLQLLKNELEKDSVQNVALAFLIPVPNHYTANAVSVQEYEKLKEAYAQHKEKMKYMICGHVHSCFEDEADGIPLICTGGGGAFIEDVSKDIKASDVEHHIVRLFCEDGKLRHEFVWLRGMPYAREEEDAINADMLKTVVGNEMTAHLKYLAFAEEAETRGYVRVANLFRALAESEYRHARAFYTLIHKPQSYRESVKEFVPGEEYEYTTLYKMMAEYAASHKYTLTEQAYRAAAKAERVHAEALKKAAGGETKAAEKIYVCPICGYVMIGENAPDRCPVCGAPERTFEVFES